MENLQENAQQAPGVTFEPYFDRVLIEKDPEETTTESGLSLSKRVRDKPMQGTVIAHGPDVRFVKIGKRVSFPKDAGIDILIDGKEYSFLVEKQLFGGW